MTLLMGRLLSGDTGVEISEILSNWAPMGGARWIMALRACDGVNKHRN